MREKNFLSSISSTFRVRSFTIRINIVFVAQDRSKIALPQIVESRFIIIAFAMVTIRSLVEKKIDLGNDPFAIAIFSPGTFSSEMFFIEL